MKRTTSSIILCSLFAGSALAQPTAVTAGIEAVMASVEANNKQLKAVRGDNAAAMAEMKAENAVGETSVEYSPFFRKGAGGVASSELTVSQEFDFPTMYGARRKSVSLRQNVLDHEYAVLRRDIMLETQKLCYDLSASISKRCLLDERLSAADSLLAICRKRTASGDANMLEQNRVSMNRMDVMTEIVRNDGDIEKIKSELERLGVTPEALVPLADSLRSCSCWDSYRPPLPAVPYDREAEVSCAEAALQMAEHDVRVSRMGWLPRISVGYRRNMEYEETALNGFIVGLSLPLFSNTKKVSAARMRKNATEGQLEDTRYRVESRRRALRLEAANLQKQLATYDVALMKQTLHALSRAIDAGELTVMEYYIEADKIYAILQERLAVENDYNKTIAELSAY